MKTQRSNVQVSRSWNQFLLLLGYSNADSQPSHLTATSRVNLVVGVRFSLVEPPPARAYTSPFGYAIELRPSASVRSPSRRRWAAPVSSRRRHSTFRTGRFCQQVSLVSSRRLSKCAVYVWSPTVPCYRHVSSSVFPFATEHCQHFIMRQQCGLECLPCERPWYDPLHSATACLLLFFFYYDCCLCLYLLTHSKPPI